MEKQTVVVNSIDEGLEIIRKKKSAECSEVALGHMIAYLNGYGIEYKEVDENIPREELLSVLEQTIETGTRAKVMDTFNRIMKTVLLAESDEIMTWAADYMELIFNGHVASKYNFTQDCQEKAQ